MRKMLFPILLTLLAAAPAGAQDDPEYRMEIGAAAGGVNYEGDFNGNLFGNMQPMGGLLWRYNFNPSSALRVMAGYGKLKGNSGDVETYYPDLGAGNAMQRRQYAFDNGLVDVSVTYEYNFWPYGTGRDYRGSQAAYAFPLRRYRGYPCLRGRTDGLHGQYSHWYRTEIQGGRAGERGRGMDYALLFERQTRWGGRSLRHRE